MYGSHGVITTWSDRQATVYGMAMICHQHIAVQGSFASVKLELKSPSYFFYTRHK